MSSDLDISQLRSWVRDELPPAERRTVGRWLMRSSDPRLEDILFGLTREFEEEKADARLRERFPNKSHVVSLWRSLWEAGAAVFAPIHGAAVPVGATLSGSRQSSGLSFRFDQPDIVIDVIVSAGPRLVSLLATTDSGEEHLLFGPEQCETGATLDVARWRIEPRDGRVTFWLCEASPDTDAEELQVLERAASAKEIVVRAARWSESPETD